MTQKIKARLCWRQNSDYESLEIEDFYTDVVPCILTLAMMKYLKGAIFVGIGFDIGNDPYGPNSLDTWLWNKT